MHLRAELPELLLRFLLGGLHALVVALDPLVEDCGALRRGRGRAEGEKGGEGKGERGFRPAGETARGGRACERIAEPCWRTTVVAASSGPASGSTPHE